LPTRQCIAGDHADAFQNAATDEDEKFVKDEETSDSEHEEIPDGHENTINKDVTSDDKVVKHEPTSNNDKEIKVEPTSDQEIKLEPTSHEDTKESF
jgi:hypothetical protein